MQSSILSAYSRPWQIGRVVEGRASGIKNGGMMVAEAWATEMSWYPVGSSVWMPLLAALDPNKSKNMATIVGRAWSCSGPTLPLSTGLGCLLAICLWLSPWAH